METKINTTVTGINWPALPSPMGAGKLAALFQLEQSQWWSAQKLREHQFIQINTLLKHCVLHVPYYREVLDSKVIQEPLNEEQWHNIPILTRDRVQQMGERLRTEILPPDHGKAFLQRTSGSTGKPVEVLGTGITAFFWDAFTLRDHFWQRRDLGGKLAVIRYTKDEKAKLPHGIVSKNWGRATSGVFETGACVQITIFTPISEQVAWLQREAPDYILTHPSVLQDLALYCQRENVQFPFLREVRTISEALPDGLRELCQKVWGIKLVDVYSSIELGYLALQCPDHDHYHVQSEGVLLEVLDDNGRPCGVGDVGRVVVTDLHNYASPLIRYEIGDFAEVGQACDCGRGLPVIKRIMGRYRNLLTLPTGERLWPLLGIQDLYKIAPVQQLQAVQHTLNDIEIRLVLPRELRSEERKELTSMFHEILGAPFNLDIIQVESIQRSVSGKYEEFISEL